MNITKKTGENEAPVFARRRLSAACPWTALVLISVLAAAVLPGCEGKTIGYGLVLWAETDGPLVTGQVLPVQQESQIQNSYLIRLEGQKEPLRVPTWRVRLFSDREQAIRGAEEYAPYLNLYAYSQRDGLPLREEADPEARRVYKLAEGQLVKVLSRGDRKVRISNYEDYWYQVLTEDGAQGYCFGYYLPAFTAGADPKAQVEELMSRDPMLEALLSTTWRPEYFRDMVENNRIDLSAFGLQYGLFFEPDSRQVRLVTSKRSQIYRYERIEDVGANRYLFAGPEIGSSGLRIAMQSTERLVLTYTRGDQVLSFVYIDFDQDIEKIVAGERRRREKLFSTFSSRGLLLRSTAYGSITLQKDMGFLWEDYGRLGEQIFLKPVEGPGVVDFPYYLSGELEGSCDGVITFRFREYSPDEGTSFLYTFDAAGVRFEYIRPEYVENLEVVRRGIASLVIYFRFGAI
jgi:hypothetical protein